jgi:hypothetical protein
VILGAALVVSTLPILATTKTPPTPPPLPPSE